MTMRRAWSPEELARALTAAGMPVTERTLRNRCAARELPARRNRRGRWRISDREVRARWPSLYLAALLRAA
jgi:hypothetical protein